MSWSRLNKKVEANFADSMRGRVSLFMTSYRKTFDGFGRGAILLDGREVLNACSYVRMMESYRMSQELQEINGCTDYWDPKQAECYYQAIEATDEILVRAGIFRKGEFHEALADYLNLSIEDALASRHLLTRALAVVDRRLGKRRLRDFPFRVDEHPAVRLLHTARCEAEAIACSG